MDSLKEYLLNIRGSYTNGYFEIYLEGDFNLNLSLLTSTDLGTFFHEYIHFLQNITTLWGIKIGIMRNNILCSFLNSIKKDEEIHIPYKFECDPITKQELDYYKLTRGSDGNDKLKSRIINTADILSIYIDPDNSQKWPVPLNKVYVKLHFSDGREDHIQLGANIVVESMAALCQSFIDPDAQHNDVPYNFVQILANKYFPKIAIDKKKLICLCYISMFSMNPGWELINMMKYAEVNIDKSGIELFDEFINDTKLIVNGKKVSVIEFFDQIIDGYKRSIKGLIGEELDYLDVVLNNVRLSNNKAPIINILNDPEPIGISHINALIQHLSIPYILIPSKDKYFYPGTINSNKGSSDIAFMVGFSRIFDFFTNPKESFKNICPFVNMCEHDHDYCYNAPWKETNCTIVPLLKRIGVYGKPIIYD